MAPALRTTAFCLLVLAGASGCSQPHDIRVRFSSAALRDATSRVEVALVESCDDQGPDAATGVILQNSFQLSEPVALGDVDSGEYGLYVRAISEECTVVATGCTEVSVDRRGGTLSVSLQPANAPACIGGFVCDSGQCVPSVGSDAGADGGLDAGSDACAPVEPETPIAPSPRILAFQRFGCMVRDGRLFCFGESNDLGQLGSTDVCGADGCLTEVIHPAGRGWTQVSTGTTFACAIDDERGLYCWGESDRGALGRATGGATPTRAADFPVSRVSCGANYVCAIKADTRTLHCWGDDGSGQTGVLTDGRCSGAAGMTIDLPARVSPPAEEPCPPITASSEVELWADVITGSDAACAHLEDGRAFCWGGVANGSTGLDEVACFPGCRSTPIGTWRELGEAVLHHRCGIRDDGELLCWGPNAVGQLGLGFASEDPTPDVGVCDPSPGDRGTEVLLSESVPVVHPMGRRWAYVSSGFSHACAIDEDGRVYCWGENDQNALGDGIPRVSLSPVAAPFPTDVLAAEVVMGRTLTCARTTDNDLYCWGARRSRCAGVADCPAVHRIPFPE